MGTLHLPFYDEASAKAFKKYMAKPWIAKVYWDDDINNYRWDTGEFVHLYSDDDMGMYLDEIADKKRKDFDIRPYVKDKLKPIVEWASCQLELKHDLTSLNLVREALGMKPLSKKRKLNPTQKTFAYIRDLLVANKFKVSSNELYVIKKVRKNWSYWTSRSLIYVPKKYLGKSVNHGEIYFTPSRGANLKVLLFIRKLNFIYKGSYRYGDNHLSFLFRAARSSEMKMPDVTSPKKITQFMVAVEKGDGETITSLLKQGMDVNVQNLEGETALHVACKMCEMKVVKLLVKNGARINTKSHCGHTPLHSALHSADLNGFFGGVKLLIENGANVNAKVAETENSRTPLHFAAFQGFFDVVKLLIKNGARIDAKDNIGYTPLHSAALGASFGVEKLLIENGANVNAQTKDGDTALHFASRNGHLYKVNFLIKNRASLTIKNNRGKTPFDLAKKHSRKKYFSKKILALFEKNKKNNLHIKSSEAQKIPIAFKRWIYLECKEGKSDKFWSAKVVKNELHIRFGRTGTKGRNSIKKFKSRKEAMTELCKKISEKEKKGYKEI